MIKIESGSVLRRNRRHLVKMKEDPPLCTSLPEDDFPSVSDQPHVESETVAHSDISLESPGTVAVTTRSGRTVKPPVRFKDYC